MSSQGLQVHPKFDMALLAQAGAWLARLHGPNRTAETEAGFRAWLEESPRHRAVFEHMTDTWEKTARLRRRPAEQLASWEEPGIRVRLSRVALAAAATVVVCVGAAFFALRTDTISTGVGEQRILTLEDGSRVYLNTASSAVVKYDEFQRRVELKAGEALFEVARQAARPFVVVAGDREIRALGTSFIVRRDEANLAVTLVDGKVVVSPRIEADGQGTAPDNEVALSPGQRVTYAPGATPRVDEPALEKVAAWRWGQVAFDDVPLPEAVAEMNRYSRTPLVLESSRAQQIRVSGIFRAGESLSFAQALLRSYGLSIRPASDRITISDGPAEAP